MAGMSGGRVGANGMCADTCDAEETVAGVETDADDACKGQKNDAGIGLAGLRRDDGVS